MRKIMNSNRVIFFSGVFIAAITVFFGLGYFFTPSAVNAKDVVKDYKPVSERFNTPGYIKALDELKTMPAEQRGAYLDKNFPRLHEDLVYYLRDRGKLQASDRVANVEFLFGSGKDVKSEDGNGNINAGKFDDQLIARVTVEGREKPMDVIVFCLNGTFELPGDLQTLGSRVPKQVFTIGPREGLTSHVDMQTSLDLAKRFSLPLFKGKRMVSANEVAPEVAAAINTDLTQVTVRVVEGDTFDLINMTFTSSPKRKGK